MPGIREGRARAVGSWARSAFRLAEVRLRIPIVLMAAAVVVGRWESIRNHWDRITRGVAVEELAKRPVSSDTEYFCPMDPGVVSNGPGRCGVCNMGLVRRFRGEAVMLPDGVVARMQLSPYRIQLAGVRTSTLGHLPLEREWRASAVAARSGEGVVATVDLPARRVPWIEEGQAVEVSSDDLPGQGPLAGRIRTIARESEDGRESARVAVTIENPPQALRGGMIVGLRFRIAVAQLDPFRDQPHQPPALKPGETNRIYLCHNHPETIALSPGHCPIDGNPRMSARLDPLDRVRWWCPMHPDVQADAPGASCEKCGGMALKPRVVHYAPEGQVLAVPQSAVVDTGDRKVVYVEGMPGMFDGIEVRLGPRCGEYYPVIGGLEPGQAVVVSGAFLLDAETRLNPALASSYFGAGGNRRATAAANSEEAPDDPIAALSPPDRLLARRQRTCPVTGKDLGSMGTPERVVVSGRTVFLCCSGCEAKLRREPGKYLAKVSAPAEVPPGPHPEARGSR